MDGVSSAHSDEIPHEEEVHVVNEDFILFSAIYSGIYS